MCIVYELVGRCVNALSNDVRGSADDRSLPRNRRREVGFDECALAAAHVLGEFVHPRARPVWTSTLLEAMATLGVEEKSARQALARTASEGVLTSIRDGRRVQWSLTAHGETLLREGTERIYGFLRSSHPWDGRWLVLTVSLPETQRALRHQLRTRLTWLGLGSPSSGLWVTPEAAISRRCARSCRPRARRTSSFAWVGPATGIGDERQLLDDAWDLAAVEELYRTFLRLFENRPAETGKGSFIAQVELVQEWRRFPFLDPDLPRELLDHDWPGLRALPCSTTSTRAGTGGPRPSGTGWRPGGGNLSSELHLGPSQAVHSGRALRMAGHDPSAALRLLAVPRLPRPRADRVRRGARYTDSPDRLAPRRTGFDGGGHDQVARDRLSPAPVRGTGVGGALVDAVEAEMRRRPGERQADARRLFEPGLDAAVDGRWRDDPAYRLLRGSGLSSGGPPR